MLTVELTVLQLLISLYGVPLAQSASYLPLHSFLFGQVAQLIMIILLLTALTLHTLTIVEPIWPMLQNVSKTLLLLYGDILLTYTAHVLGDYIHVG